MKLYELNYYNEKTGKVIEDQVLSPDRSSAINFFYMVYQSRSITKEDIKNNVRRSNQKPKLCLD